MQNDLRNAILSMYSAIESARQTQIKTGHLDQGKRMGITAGKHFDKLSSVIKNDLVSVEFKESEIYLSSNMCTIPGWYRQTKTWDILAFNNNKLV